jgi:protein SCO1/2
MRNTLVSLGLLVLAGLLASGCTTPVQAPEASIYHVQSVWTDQNGHASKLETFRGRAVVMAMIYTSCQSSCPRLVSDLQTIERKLSPEDRSKVQFLLISIDPDIDTCEKLQSYAQDHHLGSNWILFRGDSGDVQELGSALNFRFSKVSKLDYSHSDIISVLDGQGELVHQQEGPGQDPTRALQAIHTAVAQVKSP